ncbi:Ca(2+)-dependent cysteine protease MCA1 Ecym_8291 [Eremothecium cymbalariae DBVPG|uniref:Metacaspase-1 n=1 Tax=Eremothecium cymbalariae (strain CBS 270.75 / DBVPG 7215 / KCTC 17166 / NRRL Y-17582) TaxID=931890 RepID=G8JXJ6_ERECY|nr:Hypothetical protein Ecym_8291 [Eremothecium cymbalariae DBVPG\
MFPGAGRPTFHGQELQQQQQQYPGYNEYSRPGYPSWPQSSGSEYSRPPVPPPGYDGGYNVRGDGMVQGYAHPQQMVSPPQNVQYMDPAHHQVAYQYSQCTGRRKALLIGINYFGSSGELRGCINDTKNILEFLTTRHGYKEEDVVVLNDDQRDPVRIPTRANILRAMQWLVKDAQPNDALFLHYSGHGGQTEDLDGDEEDGMDDVIYPVDFEVAGHIVDDELHDILVKPLQPGVRLTALFDSCHSGTVLDLPYTYSTKGVIKEPNVWKDIGNDGLQAAMAYVSGNSMNMFSSLKSLASTIGRKATGSADVDTERVRQIKFSPADVIMFSGSKDNQTSADTVEGGMATGAMSYAFVQVLTQQPQQSYLSLLQNMRQELQSKYSQKPQLSSSHPIDVNLQFIL